MSHFFSRDKIQEIKLKSTSMISTMDNSNSSTIGRRIVHGEDLENNTPPVYENEEELLLKGGIKYKNGNSSFILQDEHISSHVLVLGEAGIGKTSSVIFPAVSSIRKSMRACDLAIILDIKGDYYREFYDSNMGDIVIGNPDISDKNKPNSPVWNLFLDLLVDGKYIKGESDDRAANFAEQFFVDRDADSNKFFIDASKECFKWILICVMRKYPQNCNNAFLFDLLGKMNANKMIELFSTENDAQSIIDVYDIAGQSEMGKGVIGELRSAVHTKLASFSAFVEKNTNNNGEFSANKLIEHPGGKFLFVEFPQKNDKAVAHIFRIFMDTFFAASCTKRTYGNVYFILDELKSLPKTQNLERALSLGRQQGVKVMAGIQSMYQLYVANGTDLAKVLTAGFVNLISMRTTDKESTEYLQDKLGERSYEETRWDLNGERKSEYVNKPVVEDYMRFSLKRGQGIVALSGVHPFVFQFAEYKSERI